jgi:hypothetical protein
MSLEISVAREIIKTPFPSIAETAEILSVPSGRVERLEQIVSAKPLHKSARRRAAKSASKSTRLAAKKVRQ